MDGSGIAPREDVNLNMPGGHPKSEVKNISWLLLLVLLRVVINTNANNLLLPDWCSLLGVVELFSSLNQSWLNI
jgi:hypothetical protein